MSVIARFAFGVTAALALTGTSGAQDATTRTSGWSADILAVNAADGIDAEEAKHIAIAYFDRHVGCGGFTAIDDGGDLWIVQGRHGFSGTEVRGFTIDKHDGAITSPIGPSYADPQMRIERPSPSLSPFREILLRGALGL